jgi:hypothetical protein
VRTASAELVACSEVPPSVRPQAAKTIVLERSKIQRQFDFFISIILSLKSILRGYSTLLKKKITNYLPSPFPLYK